ncbi:hypothetical protein ACHAXS_009466 [Conticribra weissflogii]
MSPSPPKKSKGEELYLVHLQRSNAPDPHPEDAEDDHDYPHPHKIPGGKTIGEELFCVHLKRSQGLGPDYDVDPEKGEGDDEQLYSGSSVVDKSTKEEVERRARKTDEVGAKDETDLKEQ